MKYFIVFLLLMGTVTAVCTDSDSGKIYGVKGRVDGDGPIGWDHCLNSWTLKEYFCDNGMEYEDIKCPVICRDGRCIDEELQMACPEMPCEFDAKAITGIWAGTGMVETYDSPTRFISAIYPYQFYLEKKSNIEMQLSFKMWANTNDAPNKMHVKIDDVETYTRAFEHYNANAIIEDNATVFTGILDKGMHSIRIYASTLPNYFDFGNFRLLVLEEFECDMMCQNETVEIPDIVPEQEPPEEPEEVTPEETPEDPEDPESPETQGDWLLPKLGGCMAHMTLLCHISDREMEICVAASAIPGHLDHGDYLGNCIGEVSEGKHFNRIRKNQKYNLSLEGLDIKFSLKEDKKNEKFKVRIRDVPPQGMKPHERKTHRYIVVEHGELDFEELSLGFPVEKSWIEGYEPENVVLARYEEGWYDLDTELVSEDQDRYYFSAHSVGLSLFAVTLKNLSQTMTETNTLSESKDYSSVVESQVFQDPESEGLYSEIEGGFPYGIVIFLLFAIIFVIIGTAWSKRAK